VGPLDDMAVAQDSTRPLDDDRHCFAHFAPGICFGLVVVD